MNAKHIPLLFVSLLLAACGPTVGGGGSGDPGSTGSTGTTGGGGAGGGGPTGGTGGGGGGSVSTSSGMTPEVHPAIAYTRAQGDILWEKYWEENDPSGSTSTASGGGNLDPNDLFLRVSDMGVHCDSPTVDLPCGGHYHLSLVLPPALQEVGVYDLEGSELELYSMMSETGDLNSSDPEDCPWGGGSTGPGTLEIISINDTEVHFKVAFTNGIWDSNPSGEYTALRCPSAD